MAYRDIGNAMAEPPVPGSIGTMAKADQENGAQFFEREGFAIGRGGLDQAGWALQSPVEGCAQVAANPPPSRPGADVDADLAQGADLQPLVRVGDADRHQVALLLRLLRMADRILK